MEVRNEGIVLYVIPYQEEHEIAGVFAPSGLVSLIRKWKRRKAPLSTLARYEFIWTEGRGEMGTVKEISLLDAYLPLRASLISLQAAMKCLSAVRKTQGRHGAERLYTLLRSFLTKISHAKDPQTYVSSFYLKLLIHEGVLELDRLDLEMAILAAERSFQSLSARVYPAELHQKIERMFNEGLENSS